MGIETSKITEASITASSNLGTGFEPGNSRYNRHQGSGAWCARENNVDEYIQVDLVRAHVISRVAIQEKLKTSPKDGVGVAWVTKFVVAYSQDGLSWSDYSEGNTVKVISQ